MKKKVNKVRKSCPMKKQVGFHFPLAFFVFLKRNIGVSKLDDHHLQIQLSARVSKFERQFVDKHLSVQAATTLLFRHLNFFP
jgi:hypothetical protein